MAGTGSLDLAAQYDWLWQQFLKTVPKPFHASAARPDEDQRRGVTIVGRFSTSRDPDVWDLLSCLRTHLAGHFIYSDASLHVTAIVPVPAGFREDVPPEAYVPAFAAVTANIRDLDFRIDGMSAAGSAIVLRAFPIDSAFEELRAALRRELSTRGLPNLEQDLSCYDGVVRPRCTAHVTLARLAFSDEHLPERLSRCAVSWSGVLRIGRLELVRHDEFMTPEKCRILSSVDLLVPKGG